MSEATIAIIGAGHMGMSLLGGLMTYGYPAHHIFLADPAIEKLETAKQQFNINITTNNIEAAKTSHVIIFAIKPEKIASVAQEITDSVKRQKPLIISVAAGIPVSSIQHELGSHVPIIRTMPNTPALLGCGATALYANSFVSKEQRLLAESILRSVGVIVWLDDEKLMDAVTALSGSGPAYFFLIIEAMQQAGEALGLTPEAAHLLTLQTAYGAARLALESKKSVVELRQQAMTPGGTTEQALRVLEENNIRHIIFKAMQAAANRAKELGLIDHSEN